MEEIMVVVKPVFEVVKGGEFDRFTYRETTGEEEAVKYCYNCGSALFYMQDEFEVDKETNIPYLASIDWYCAVCGRGQGGVRLPNPFEEDEE